MIETQTYIIVTKEREYYCGKTINVEKRIAQHKQEKKPHWFSFKNRKNFSLFCIIDGNYEKEIKRFGVKKFTKCIKGVSLS